jgi:hypothetical protein
MPRTAAEAEITEVSPRRGVATRADRRSLAPPPHRLPDKELQGMSDLKAKKAIAVHPRCDGRRLLFEIVDEGRSVACAISLMALEEVSESRCFRPADQLKSFAAARQRIEAIALGKIQAQTRDTSVLLNIWSSDFDDPPPAAEPIAEGAAKSDA